MVNAYVAASVGYVSPRCRLTPGDSRGTCLVLVTRPPPLLQPQLLFSSFSLGAPQHRQHLPQPLSFLFLEAPPRSPQYHRHPQERQRQPSSSTFPRACQPSPLHPLQTAPPCSLGLQIACVPYQCASPSPTSPP